MILTVQLELHDGTIEGTGPSRLEIRDSEVRDPAVGVIGHARGSGRIIWRDGRRYLEITIDVDDQAAVDAAATRSGPVF